jgi:hypothetical protein
LRLALDDCLGFAHLHRVVSEQKLCASSYIIYLVVGIKKKWVCKREKNQKRKEAKSAKSKERKKETPLAISSRKAQAR